MDLLGNYDSGDEGSDDMPINHSVQLPSTENDHGPECKKTATNEKFTLDESANQKIKKKRKLTLSFLPPEILNALTRGDTMKDSDDELEVSQARRGSQVVPNTSCQLLSLLPAPSKSTSHSEPNAIKPSAPAVGIDNNPPISKTSFSLNYTAVQETKRSSSATAEIPIRNIKPVVNTFPKQPIKPLISQQSFLNNPLYESEGMEDVSIDTYIGPKIISPSEIAQNTYSSSSIGYMEPSQHISYHDSFSRSSSNKKREREIEQQLLNGNVSVLPGGIVKELNMDRKWDATKYSDQQQREAMIHKEFGLTTQRSLMQPTKQMNRKHQLSSLAIKAAEVELAMLDARGSRMKSKSETQGKYGW
mmetsp:Transcript_27353/g.37712  ORF Transcript_27353/g.37712 Transcript_27353/m.37712 type:complete len:360 (+) Transcript_27353:45-1124(+)